MLDNSSKIKVGLAKLSKSYIPKNNGLTYRLPQGEMKIIASQECPVKVDPKTKNV